MQYDGANPPFKSKSKEWGNSGRAKRKTPWQKRKRAENINCLGNVPGIMERLETLGGLLTDDQNGVYHDPTGIGRKDGILSEVSSGTIPRQSDGLFTMSDGKLGDVVKMMRQIPSADGATSMCKQAASDILQHIEKARRLIRQHELKTRKGNG